MKTAFTAQQLVYFRKNGHIRFENFPTSFDPLEQAKKLSVEKRDLWRKAPLLRKLIEKDLGPIVLELSGKDRLRIGLDQWLDAPAPQGRMQDLFCIQGLALIAVVSQGAVDLYEPSSLTSLLAPDTYLIAYALDNARYVANPKDPYAINFRKMGYNYGDLLINEFHPLIFPR